MILSGNKLQEISTPTEEEITQAIATSQFLLSYLDKKQLHSTAKEISSNNTKDNEDLTILKVINTKNGCVLVVQDISNNKTKNEEITIPYKALNLLIEILTEMGKGNAVKIVPIKKELTTSEAASLLNVSLPYLVDLLESGQIPFYQVGSRLRVLLKDVMNYKNQIDAKRENTLAELASQAQELDLGY